MNPDETTRALIAQTFPDCVTSYMEQRSEEWFDARRGNITASAAGEWLTAKTKVAAKARTTAIGKLLAEIARCEEAPRFETWGMKRGTELEPAAVESFEAAMGVEVIGVGFCQSKLGRFGCSPDGLIRDLRGVGFEGKAPEPGTHFAYFLDPSRLVNDYGGQVQFSLAVTGGSAWHLQSFCPGQPAVRVVIERDAKTDLLRDALQEFSDQVDAAVDQVREAWQDEFGEEQMKRVSDHLNRREEINAAKQERREAWEREFQPKQS